MLNEPASSLDDGNARRKGFDMPTIEPGSDGDDPAGIADSVLSELRALVRTVFAIERETYPADNLSITQREDLILFNPARERLLVSFHGRLTLPSEDAYDKLDGLLKQRDMLPVFRRDGNAHVIHIMQGRMVAARGGNYIRLMLFLLTVLCVLYVGAGMAINEIAATNPRRADMLEAHFWTELWRGWPYALSILLILGAHEMGHYVMARRHHIAVSPPYFLPFPFGPFGTMGATIRMHQPARNRKILLDISAAGPLAGLAVAVPILLIGLANSRIGPVSEGLAEGNSIAYAAAKVIAIGHYLPDGMDDVHVNQMAWAGWIGLFITSLHLIPIGQLDGGNVLYALMGRYARFAHFPALAALVIMVLVSSGVFLFIAVLLLFLGRVYAVPLDDITPLNPTRRWIGVLILAIFVLVFVPVPLRRIVVEAGNPVPGFNAGVVLLWMWLAYNRLRWRGLQPPV